MLSSLYKQNIIEADVKQEMNTQTQVFRINSIFQNTTQSEVDQGRT